MRALALALALVAAATPASAAPRRRAAVRSAAPAPAPGPSAESRARALARHAMNESFPAGDVGAARRELEEARALCTEVDAGCAPSFVATTQRDLAVTSSALALPDDTTRAHLREAMNADRGVSLEAHRRSERLARLYVEVKRELFGASTAETSARAPVAAEQPPAAPRDVPTKRVWLGVEGSLDVTFASSADDVCATVQGRPTNRDHFCTMGGADAPNGDDLQRGQLDSVAGGPALGNTRVKLRLDWAIDEHWIAGVRAGYVFGTYPGEAARREGRSFLPVDLEARMTHLIGRRPLARGSVAQYLYLGAGVAQTDVRVAVDVVDRSGKVTNVDAWELGGIFYASAGLGVRYALADNVGASFGPRFALPLAGGAILPVASPEAALSFGF